MKEKKPIIIDNIFVLLTLFLYMPLHFFEEASGNFPEWMFHHWTPIHLTYGRWMGNNVFIFWPILVISVLIYLFFPKKCIYFGGAVLVWGLANSADHIVYTIMDKAISPGLFTGLLFLLNAIIGIRTFVVQKKLNLRTGILSVVTGLIIFFLPWYLCATLHFTSAW